MREIGKTCVINIEVTERTPKVPLGFFSLNSWKPPESHAEIRYDGNYPVSQYNQRIPKAI